MSLYTRSGGREGEREREREGEIEGIAAFRNEFLMSVSLAMLCTF